MEGVVHQLDGGQFCVGDFDAGGVAVGIEFGLDTQTLSGGGMPDEINLKLSPIFTPTAAISFFGQGVVAFSRDLGAYSVAM